MYCYCKVYLFTFFIVDHISQYFKKCNSTFSETSDEFVETVHHVLKEMENDHNIAVRKKNLLGSSIHLERLLTSICLFNYRNLGFSLKNVDDIPPPRIHPPPGPDMNSENWHSSFHDYFDHFD